MKIKKIKECSAFTAGDKTIIRELMHPLNDKIDIGYSLAHAEVKKGQSSVPHRLKGSELYHILAGMGVMHIEDQSFFVEPGDSFLVPPNALQYIENRGEESLVFLCIVEPFWQESNELIE